MNSEEVIGSPTDSAQLNLIWEKGPIGVRWQTNYVGAQLYSRTFNAESRDILELSGDYVHNLSVNWQPVESAVVRLSVTNVLDSAPPFPLGDGHRSTATTTSSEGVTRCRSRTTSAANNSDAKRRGRPKGRPLFFVTIDRNVYWQLHHVADERRAAGHVAGAALVLGLARELDVLVVAADVDDGVAAHPLRVAP